ncbi:MAG: ABC transporter ATP-binding protein [Candidatus Bathyarchaeota archaeon]|nr:ABC transporter ATP-binding protein [Candidatus Bathyarchaeota archaeon]
MVMMILQVDDVKFSYDGKRNVFEHVSFSVEKGEVFCILGPNGSGKSTLLRCIDALLTLDGGNVYLNGKTLASISRKKIATDIGFLPQLHVSTFPFSVLEVAVMGRSPHLGLADSPSPKDYALAESNLKLLGLDHLADKPYTKISGGERQLALIAMVLTQQPRILLLDEPTSHLDFGNQVRMLEIIKNLSQKGLSIILTTHFPDHAFHLSSTVAMMNKGSFIASGTAENVITEANLKTIYGIDVKVACFDSSKICVPVKK